MHVFGLRLLQFVAVGRFHCFTIAAFKFYVKRLGLNLGAVGEGENPL